MALSFESIPTLSLGAWRAPDTRVAFAEHLRDVCHNVGFLQLVDHGIEPEFFDRYFAMLAAFFALDEEHKASIDKAKSRFFRGWERVGAELTDNRVDYREQLDVSTEQPALAAGVTPAYLRLYGPNQWLDDAVLPGFRAAVTAFHDRMRDIANELMGAICAALELDEGHLAALFGTRTHSLVKLIRYPASPEGEAGVNAHHDAGFLTLLAQHDVGGLQALSPDGEWIDVPPTRGALVVNLGEMLQSMTGNYFVATKHRVIAPGPRFSSAYFHGPELSTSLASLPLGSAFAEAVAASPRHAGAGFMAKRDELLSGQGGTQSTAASTYGEQLWNYYCRSYPNNVRTHYPELLA